MVFAVRTYENWLFLFSRGTDLILFFCRKHIGLLTSDASGKVMPFFAHGTNSSQGVAILITSCLGYNKRQIRSDNDGRVLNMILEVEDRTLNLINAHRFLFHL